MITLERDDLVFRFPEVHRHAELRVSFQRTLRIPDDGRDYPLPPGLGAFPLCLVDDFSDRLPASSAEQGGVLLPMYQAEAMWLAFDADYPIALKIATGGINAISGRPWSHPLDRDGQDYVVLPEQRWLDGYCVAKGVIRQFVAAPQGGGITVEEQLTGRAEWGGLQLLAYPMRRDRHDDLERQRRREAGRARGRLHEDTVLLGVAAGGRMSQNIYVDRHGIDDWDQQHGARCFVSIVDSVSWPRVTGSSMPTPPVTAADYAEAGLPWFDYDTGAPALAGSAALAAVTSVAAAWPDPHSAGGFAHSVPVDRVIRLAPRRVRGMKN
jgi:hypothetical protein